jgi:hypothetical protein
MIYEKTPNLNKIIDEIEYLKQSHTFLEDLYISIGPYLDREIPKELWYKIRDHFNFDDSE